MCQDIEDHSLCLLFHLAYYDVKFKLNKLEYDVSEKESIDISSQAQIKNLYVR